MFVSLLRLDLGHPSIELQRRNFANVNGEDIELASRELSQAQQSTRGRSEVYFCFVFTPLD